MAGRTITKTMAQLRCQQLNFAYPDATPLLQQIDFTVESGQWLTIIGASGSGKTTLLKNLKPELAPHGELSGNIYVNDENIAQWSLQQSATALGFVHQSPETQIVTDRVWHELAFGLENIGLDQQEIRKRVAEIAHYFGIHRWFHDDTMHLSGGQKQLVNVAAILAMRPKILLLDEPTAQLDPIAAKSFLQTIKQLQQDLGLTIIIVEHRLEEVLPLSDQVIVLEHGKKIYDGTPTNFAKAITVDSPLYDTLPIATRLAMRTKMIDYPITIQEGQKWVKAHITKTEPFIENPLPTKQLLVQAMNIHFRYAQSSAPILTNFSCDIYEGEVLAIVGSNGSGKSTALKCISHLLKPQRGTIELAGKRINHYKAAELYTQWFGILPQNPRTLFLHKTVEQELFDGMSQSKKALVTMYIDRFDVGHCLNRHPYDCSGGEQQKIALIKILVNEPKILLLDEPTKGLDPHMKQELISLVKQLKENGQTIVIVSHDLEFCAAISDRCSMFFDGQLLATQTPRNFFASNRFYTTAAHRLSYPHLENAITFEDVLSRC